MRGRAYRRLWRRGCPRAALRQRTSCAWPLGAQGERVVGRRGARVRRSLPRDLCEAERLITALAQISAPMHAPEHLSMPRCLACQAGPGSCAALYGHVRRTAWASGWWLRLSVDQSLATSTMHQQKHFLGRYTCGRARGRSRFREGGARAPSSPMRSRDMLRLAGLALTVSSSSGLAATALSPQLRGTASRAASMPFLRVAAAGPRMDEAPTLEEEVRTCSQPRGSVHARAVGSLRARVGIVPALTPFFRRAPPRANRVRSSWPDASRKRSTTSCRLR